MSDPSLPQLLLGVKPIAERQVRAALFGTDRLVSVVGSAAEATELCALAERRPADAALVSPALSGLGAGQCGRLRTQGLRVLGLALDDHDAARLDALGVDRVLRPPLAPAELAAACLDTPTAGASTEHSERKAVPNGEHAAVAHNPELRRAGSVLAVVAAEGSPGASECACSLAGLAHRRWPTILCELDLHAGSLDLRLGHDPHQGSLLGLVRASTDGDSSLRGLLDRWSAGSEDGWPPVLLAPPDPEAVIDELARPGAIRAALEAAASVYPLVIADVGALLSTAGEIPTIARCHREALLTADAVLLVIGAREDQLQAGRAQLAVLLDELELKRERLRLCVSGAGAAGAAHKGEAGQILAGELAALYLAIDGWLPYDRRAAIRASCTGLPLTLARPRGPYTRALRRLLDTLFIPAQPVTRERKRRLHIPTTEPEPLPFHGDDARDEEVPLPWRN